MSIKVSDLIQAVRGLVSEDEEKYFKDTFFILAFNGATLHAFSQLQTISEFMWLVPGSITITAAHVTNGTRIHALPDRTGYVSNYCFNANLPDRDWRPKLIVGADTTVLYDTQDYSISLPNFVLHNDPVSEGTIEFWYKAPPARVNNPIDPLTYLTDHAFNYYVEYGVWYAERRDENENPLTDPRIQAELFALSRLLTNAGGLAKGFESNWDDVAGYD